MGWGERGSEESWGCGDDRMIISREWAMPNKNTFEIKPIRKFIDEEMCEGLWIDPYANRNRI